MTFVAVRHETGDELDALGEGCRVAVAEELRRLAHGRSIMSPEELIDRANALDPEGATR